MNNRFGFAICIAALLAAVLSSSAATLRILPVGDSITDGAGAAGGYRAPLYLLLTNAGFNVDFLGTLNVNCVAGLPDCNHEGHSGWRIDQIDSIILSVFSQMADPDIILVLIGTNDYGQGYDTAHATNRLEALIAKMATSRPSAKIVVANLLVRGEPLNTQIQNTFNPFVPSIVQRQRALGREVYFDDLRSAVPLADMPDQLHPNLTGYRKMATNWFGFINSLFNGTNPPTISRAYATGSLTNVIVTFSKPVADDAATVTNFSLSGGVAILGAALDPASQRDVTLTTTPLLPSNAYTVTVNGVRDRTTNHLQIAANSTAVFTSPPGRGVLNNVSEAGNYTLVYSLDIPNAPNYATNIAYDIDLRAYSTNFTRVAYYLELQTTATGPMNYLWVSFAAFTNDANQIGVPTASSGASFQQSVANMDVLSSVAGIVTGTNLQGGNIEFWPGNYGPANWAGVSNASSAAYDWGDSRSASGNYGSMQIHNHDARQVLLAFNRWGGVGGIADLGIGNNQGAYLDWTSSQNAGSYTVKTLQVFVLPAERVQLSKVMVSPVNTPGRLGLSWEARPGSSYSIWKKLNLDSTPWTNLGRVMATAPTATFIDLQATNGTSFYQISTP
jgi:lysophospholipase L1-like esterase